MHLILMLLPTLSTTHRSSVKLDGKQCREGIAEEQAVVAAVAAEQDAVEVDAVTAEHGAAREAAVAAEHGAVWETAVAARRSVGGGRRF
jgi:hypothetical protein